MKLAVALHKICHQWASLRIGDAREISLRLVQKNVCVLFRLDLELISLPRTLM
jgi:hypothetical protein